MKKLCFLLFTLLLALTLTGCGTTVDYPAEDGPLELPQALEPAPVYYHPLTNEQSDQPFTGRLRFYSIDNNEDARPQSGISQAELLYEVPAEGGIPRLLAVFYCNSSEKIGPIRSTRPYMVDIVRMWGGALFHCGWSEDAKAYLQSNVIDYCNELGASSYFWRDDNRWAPHNLYTDSEESYRFLQDNSLAETQELEPLTFRNQDEPRTGEQVERLRVKYPYADNVYTYDAATGLYSRFTDDEEFIDQENGEQIQVSNVIVQRISSQVVDSLAHLEVDMTAGGEAWLFSEGTVTVGTWSCDSLDSRTDYLDGEGNAFQLADGVTFIQVIDGNCDLEYEVIEPEPEVTDEPLVIEDGAGTVWVE